MARMFERWPVSFTPTTRRMVDPPLSVTIDLGYLIDDFAEAPFRADAISMRVKSEGLHLNGRVPGQIHAWAKTTRGTWIGLVSCEVRTGNGNGCLDIRQWCSAKAITPNPPAA